jgi:hypothetical protein
MERMSPGTTAEGGFHVGLWQGNKPTSEASPISQSRAHPARLRDSPLFVYFYQFPKKCKIFSQNPLTILDLCDKIVNCIIIALIMGISAL